MKLQKQEIAIHELPKFELRLQELIKNANPLIEKLRCVCSYKDSSIIYLYTAFDFIDNYQTIIIQDQLKNFYVFQPFDAS